MAWLSLEEICVWTVLGFAVLGWLVLAGIKLNYGRLSSSLAKIYIDPRIGWFVFEVPNLLWAGYFLLRGDPLSLGFLLFIVHYVNRDIIYPLRLKTQTKVPLEIMLSAFCFTAANGYLQGLANAETSNHSILLKTAGVVLFFSGMGINIHSDNILQAAKEKLLK